MRTESRKFQPWVSVLIPAVLVAIVAGGSWMLWLRHVEQHNTPPFRSDWVPLSAMQIPAGLGSSPMSALAIITALVTALWTIYAVRSRASSLLREEALRGTLDSLQMLPMREERWLWMMSLHPLLIAMLIWCVGLPVYMLAVWMGIWTLNDLIGLLFVWLWLGHVAPLWQPVMWKQNGKTPQRVDANTLRAVLLLKTEASSRGLSLAQSLELQRRAQRLLLDAGKTLPSKNADENRVLDEPQAEATAIEDKKNLLNAKVEKDASSGRRDARAGWNWRNLFIAFFVVRLITSWGGTVGGGIFNLLYNDIVLRLEDEVPPMIPWIMVTWPVVLAKVLLSPLSFFSFSLPPILVLAPLWIGFSRSRNILLASLVSASETFWTERRAREKTTVTRAMQICAAVSALGFMWRTFITSGELAPAFWGSAVMPDSGASLAVLWTIFVIIGALAAWRASEAIYARHAREESAVLEDLGRGLQETEKSRYRAQLLSMLRKAWRDAARTAAYVFLGMIGVYFVSCWLGGTIGWSVSWQQRALFTTLTACVFIFVCWSTSALHGALPLEARNRWAWARAVWFFWPPVEIVLRALFNAFTSRPDFVFEQAPHTLFSPFVTLFALLRADLAASLWLWGSGIATQFVLGVACMLWARHITFAQAGSQESNAGHVQQVAQQNWRERVLDGLLWLPRVIWRVLSNVFSFVMSFSARFSHVMERGNAKIIARGVALDNAVLTGELRRRVRKVNWCRHGFLVGLLGLTLFVLFSLYPLGNELLWKSQFVGWRGAFTTYNWSDWATGLIFVTLLICGAISVFSVSDLGRSYDADRANGTLVFLFLTPMQDRDMLRGKLLTSVSYSLLMMSAALPFLLLGALVSGLIGEWSLIVFALTGVFFVISLLAFLSGLQLFFGVRSAKPGTGSSKALGVGLVIEMALWALFTWIAVLISPRDAYETLMWWVFYIVLCVVHFGVGILSWHLALRSLRALRLGKVGTDGKVAG